MLSLVCDQDITIFYKQYNPTLRKDGWSFKQLSGVSWFGGQKVNVSSRGLDTADTYTVRIPEALTDGYVAQKDYSGEAGTWTIQAGGYVVLGLVDTIPEKIADLTHQTSFVVTGVYDNRRGTNLRHIKVMGK